MKISIRNLRKLINEIFDKNTLGWWILPTGIVVPVPFNSSHTWKALEISGKNSKDEEEAYKCDNALVESGAARVRIYGSGTTSSFLSVEVIHMSQTIFEKLQDIIEENELRSSTKTTFSKGDGGDTKIVTAEAGDVLVERTPRDLGITW